MKIKEKTNKQVIDSITKSGKKLIKGSKKSYVIIGNNNFWLHSLENVSKKELKEGIKEVKGCIKNIYEYNDAPTELYIFEVKNNPKVLKLK